jgi:hypothetical protein
MYFAKMNNNTSAIEYTLYKEPVSLDTLHIVQYLHSNGIILTPKCIIERNHGVNSLPTIVANSHIYSGLNEVLTFYETVSGISDILNKANKWKIDNPNYRINS